jgi:21S rRNA (uridine2791-2'-O)-methyltransferase|tara:strand:- start:14217 stop:14543 length:327 start_codon:yes stop_codon:yes gene_type:complete
MQDLCMAALTFGFDTLKTGGHFLCKYYQGSEEKAFETKLKRLFAKVHREKPDSSRNVMDMGYVKDWTDSSLGIQRSIFRRASAQGDTYEGGDFPRLSDANLESSCDEC